MTTSPKVWLGQHPGADSHRAFSGVAVTLLWCLSPELARVQEALLAACSRAREAEAELGQRRGKQRRLAEELSECQESVRQLRDERRSLQEDNNR